MSKETQNKWEEDTTIFKQNIAFILDTHITYETGTNPNLIYAEKLANWFIKIKQEAFERGKEEILNKPRYSLNTLSLLQFEEKRPIFFTEEELKNNKLYDIVRLQTLEEVEKMINKEANYQQDDNNSLKAKYEIVNRILQTINKMKQKYE